MEPRFQRRKEQLLAGCQVPPALFRGVIGRLEEFAVPFAAALPSPESRRHTRTYLAGLLSDVERTNAESIAYRYDLDRQVLQRFVGEVDWGHDPLIGELTGQVARAIGRPDAVLVFDPSAFPKKGAASVGVQRQWCGRRGRELPGRRLPRLRRRRRPRPGRLPPLPAPRMGQGREAPPEGRCPPGRPIPDAA
jgi:hypothetical protein